ncbi:glycosyl transferase group 1 family protein [Aureimonas sp. Leaf454]|uniref:glycosyltransferase family 4 protein n=1 Tax=Aureimonas sp. Leaf454 TaxID=1736381 RepID=UPI0007019A80|nr:glycosyltransferase family 4 protein [Aureimonas sp. Leaf454]KQT48890.1 glycosyl transferase group 1 family protein [Aureimonas sp. Leaf454]
MTLDPGFRFPRGEGLLPERIAIVSHSHPSVSKGGAEIAAYSLYRGLRDIGVDAIFVGACNVADRHRLALGSEHEFAVYFEGDRYDHFFHLAPRAVTEQLVSLLQAERIGLVNFHHFFNLGLNALRAVRELPGMRSFLTIHEFLGICQNHGQMITRQTQSLCERATNENCVSCFPEHLRTQFTLRKETMLGGFGDFDGFISPSRFLAERFIDWGLPADRTTVIENGLLSTPARDLRASRSGGAWTFGFFGQINPFKGVDVVLDAADLVAKDPDLVRNVRFRIHGNLIGQSEAFNKRFEDALKTHAFLSYAGPYANAAVHRLMGECDYVLIPSKWWENSPVVIQEAYSVGAPVICTGIGGMAEKVPDGVSGLHFRLGDASDLLRAMRLASDPDIAAGLRSGIPAVTTAADMARRYAAFFALSIAGGAAPADRRARSAVPA